MKRAILIFLLCLPLGLFLSGCGADVKADPKAEMPPPAVVEHESDANVFKVDRPEQFPLATAAQYDTAPQLNVTGSITADISRNIPVISLAAGRIIEIDARLGDTVTKGQLLMKVQSQDIAQAFSDYRQAVADETLAKAQLNRSKTLYEKGAIAQKDLEVAEDTDVKAQVTVETAREHLRVLGADVNQQSSIIEIHAPVAGVITDQQVTTAAGTQGLASPNPFTISDTSHVWIMCDVYENDLSFVRVGEYADIHLGAYPKMVLKGRIQNILPTLDPSLRTAKVRLEVDNPGLLRFGMFVTATFHGLQKEIHAMVPATAILHLHDRDWVYTPMEGGRFRRLEVVGGAMLPDNMQEVTSGLSTGQQVVKNALVLQATVEQ
ncbi:MAG TPA: efflux RND transporter periplasmic adaptor subunit [Bryobacteraceae bacterium]|nr:efflux RND transporter periplasmic adaptor subunit [Bryobacteraceae bacterium]